MRRVILESPFAGEIEANLRYARACLRDSLERGEAPIASHLLYTQPGVLDDSKPDERDWGIRAGLAWREVAEAAVFYLDRGWSLGMIYAKAKHLEHGLIVETRTLPGYVAPALPIRTIKDDIEEALDWIDFSQLDSPYEQRMTRAPGPVSYQHRKRGDTEWIDGRPPK